MTTSKTTIMHYNGTLWRALQGPDWTRRVQPYRLADGALAAQGATRCYRGLAQRHTGQTAAATANTPWVSPDDSAPRRSLATQPRKATDPPCRRQRRQRR